MVGYNLYSPYVDITTLPFFDRITVLRLSVLPVHELVFPPHLVELHCCRIGLEYLPDPLPKTLKVMICKNNKLKYLPKLPHGLKKLDCSNNPLLSLDDLPNLVLLNCSNCGLNSLPDLPPTLITLISTGNNLVHLPRLFKGLRILRCSGNNLKELIRLPTSLVELDCKYNEISEIDHIDDLINLKFLDCRWNKVSLYTSRTTRNEKILMSLSNCVIRFQH